MNSKTPGRVFFAVFFVIGPIIVIFGFAGRILSGGLSLLGIVGAVLVILFFVALLRRMYDVQTSSGGHSDLDDAEERYAMFVAGRVQTELQFWQEWHDRLPGPAKDRAYQDLLDCQAESERELKAMRDELYRIQYSAGGMIVRHDR